MPEPDCAGPGVSGGVLIPVCRFLVLLAALLSAGCGRLAGDENVGTDDQRLYGATRDWPLSDGGAAADHYSWLDHIHDHNISTLGFRWQSELAEGPIRAEPLVLDDVMVVCDGAGRVHALDAASGDPRWSFDTRPPEAAAAANDVDRRLGIAAGSGTLFCATPDGRLLAIRMSDGEQLWKSQELSAITATPRLAGGQILVTGRNEDGRNRLIAHDVQTGGVEWQRAAAAPLGELIYDPRLELVYVGSGTRDADAEAAAEERLLPVSSVLAIEPDSGEFRWASDLEPEQVGDALSPMILADLTFDQVPRQVILQATLAGSLQVRDRTNGELVANHEFVDRAPLPRRIVALASNVRKGLVYVLSESPPPEDELEPTWELHAIDPIAGSQRWRLALNPPGPYVGLLSTAGNLIFVGDPDKYLDVYAASSGRLLEREPIGGHLTGAPITFVAAGRQLVAISVQQEQDDREPTQKLICLCLGGGEIPDVLHTPEDLRRYPATVTRPAREDQ